MPQLLDDQGQSTLHLLRFESLEGVRGAYFNQLADYRRNKFHVKTRVSRYLSFLYVQPPSHGEVVATVLTRPDLVSLQQSAIFMLKQAALLYTSRNWNSCTYDRERERESVNECVCVCVCVCVCMCVGVCCMLLKLPMNQISSNRLKSYQYKFSIPNSTLWREAP